MLSILSNFSILRIFLLYIGSFLFVFNLSNCQTSIEKKSEDIRVIKVNNSNQDHFLELEGKKIHYRIEGKGDVIVLLHGLGVNLKMWDKTSEYLKKNYQVLSIDLPGFNGKSEAFFSKRNHSFKNQAIFLDKFITALSLENFHLVGSSWGGGIAWKYATDHPKKVLSLTLISSTGAHHPMLNNIECPTLILWGKKDKLTPLNDGYIIKKKIKNSKLLVYDKGKHVPVNKLFSEFIIDFTQFLSSL